MEGPKGQSIFPSPPLGGEGAACPEPERREWFRGEGGLSPVAEVQLSLDGQQVTTPCFVAPGGPPLLGAVALESLFLAIDPVAKRLVPVEGFVGSLIS